MIQGGSWRKRPLSMVRPNSFDFHVCVVDAVARRRVVAARFGAAASTVVK